MRSLLLLVGTCGLAACSSGSTTTNTSPAKTIAAPLPALDAGLPDAAPPPPPRYLKPQMTMRNKAAGARVNARVFAFADTQLHYIFGKRTFAQSPFADRMAFEVAVRPAALDDGSDLLLRVFADEYINHYSDHGLVFLGDAADLSCDQELGAFLRVLKDAGISALMSVASNHDGFFVGNFTSKDDLDGKLALTDMPRDWTRACSFPGSLRDNRLTKGRAIARFSKLLPEGPLWAGSVAHLGATGTDDYKSTWMYYVRRLQGGDQGAAPVWGVFLDTVDYRGFDLKAAEGAGSTGGVSRLQLRFLDRAMFEAAGTSTDEEPIFVVFGHHPVGTLEPASRKRLKRFLAAHPRVIAYVSAHEHAPARRRINAGGRLIPEYIVGSTTDFPHSAARIEVRTGARGPTIAVENLIFDRDHCDGIDRMPPTSLGYTGYRINRDDTPDVDIGIVDKLAFAVGLSDLEEQRAKQAIGALLVENELVRSLADLYLRSPIPLSPPDHARLTRLVSIRYAAGNTRASVEPYLRGLAVRSRTLPRYERWDDPVVAKVVSVAAQGVHRFGPYAGLFRGLREHRKKAANRRYFLCHGVYAAEAESKRAHKRGGVLFIR